MKKFLAIALAAVMLFAFAACGGDRTETDAKTQSDASADLVKVIDISLSSEEYGIAAKKGYVGLMAKVNDTLAQLYADGTMKEIAKVYGLDQLLVSSSWSNYTKTFDSLSDAEKASWNNIVSKEKIVIGYTLFAPIAYK